MSYLLAAALAAAVAVVLDLRVLRTRLVVSRVFWTTYGVVLAFQLLSNGVLTGRGVVHYDDSVVVGVRIAYAPVEDLVFGFALVLQTLSWWVWWGRVLSARAATTARRPSETETRRSSTR